MINGFLKILHIRYNTIFLCIVYIRYMDNINFWISESLSKEILSPGYDKRNYNQICHLPFSFVSRNRYCFTKTKGRKTIK